MTFCHECGVVFEASKGGLASFLGTLVCAPCVRRSRVEQNAGKKGKR